MSRITGLRMAELVMALSLATDLGTGQPMEWALTSCLLAVRLGQSMGLGQQDLHDVYYVTLLRWIGCTANADMVGEVFGNDQTTAGRAYRLIDPGQPLQTLGWVFQYVGRGQQPVQRLGTLARMATATSAMTRADCEVAQALAARLGFSPAIQTALTQTYERWDGRGTPAHLKGATVALPSRIASLAQDAETFRRLGGVAAAVSVAQQRAGGAYDPAIAAHFCARAPQLLQDLDDLQNWDAALAAEPGERRYLSEDEIDAGAQALADFTDMLAPFLRGHSRGVAALAAAAAARCGLPAAEVVAVRRAGWLHDLGRIGVPAGIWSQPRPLTGSEWERVRLHPYYTARILARAPILAALGALAAQHHERLDASGYPRNLSATAQSFGARLLAAADVYHALTEDRAHRPARAPEAAALTLRQEVRAGRLDDRAADAVLAAAANRPLALRRQRIADLTAREIEVLQLLARGLPNREMAAHLSLSQKTVGNHIMHIYEKIGVSTRAGAALFAMQHDLLTD